MFNFQLSLSNGTWTISRNRSTCTIDASLFLKPFQVAWYPAWMQFFATPCSRNIFCIAIVPLPKDASIWSHSYHVSNYIDVFWLPESGTIAVLEQFVTDWCTFPFEFIKPAINCASSPYVPINRFLQSQLLQQLKYLIGCSVNLWWSANPAFPYPKVPEYTCLEIDQPILRKRREIDFTSGKKWRNMIFDVQARHLTIMGRNCRQLIRFVSLTAHIPIFICNLLRVRHFGCPVRFNPENKLQKLVSHSFIISKVHRHRIMLMQRKVEITKDINSI